MSHVTRQKRQIERNRLPVAGPVVQEVAPMLPVTPPEDRPVRRTWLWVLVGLLLLLVAGGSLLAAGGLVLYQSDRILPGVSALGVDLGTLRSADAEAALQQAWRARTIEARTADTVYTLDVAELGLALDAKATAQAAHAVGRSGGAWQEALQALISGWEVTPVYRLNEATARQRLQALAEEIDRPAGQPGVQLVNGRAEIVPATPGQALDVGAALATLWANPAAFAQGQPLPLVVQPVEAVAVDAVPLVAELNRRLVNTLLVHAFDPVHNEVYDWQVQPAIWASWLEVTAEGGNLDWNLLPAQVEAFVQQQSATLPAGQYLDVPAVAAAIIQAIEGESYRADGRVYHRPGEHIVQAGETISSIAYNYGIPYPWILQANPDLGDILSVGQRIIIPSPDDLLPLPVVENKRIVVSIAEQRMWAYENGELRWEWVVSTGIASSPTAPGVFQVQSHEENAYAGNWDLWMPHFLGIYRPAPQVDFMNGFHGFPTRNGTTLLWTGDLGHPVTYGCILLSSDNAALLYEWAEDGVIVEVRG